MKIWCTSLPGIVGPPEQSSLISGNKFRSARPERCQILSHSDKKWARCGYRYGFVCSQKKWTKFRQNPLRSAIRMHQWPPLCQLNFIALDQMMYEKSIAIFYTFSILAPQGTPSAKVRSFDVQQGTRSAMPNFVPFWQPAYLRDNLLPNFVDFVESVTDNSTKNSKQLFPHAICGHNKVQVISIKHVL